MRVFTTGQSRLSWLSLTVLAAFFLFIGLSHGHPAPGGNLSQLSQRGNSDSKPKAPKPGKGPKGPKGGEPSAPPPSTSYPKGKKVGFKKNIDRLPPFKQPKEPQVAYRGETREPEAIEAAEGFFPRAPTRALEAAETELGSSIYGHVAVKVAKEYTGYVSTSMDPGAASDFGRSSGYVYVIAPDEKLINVPETLGEFMPAEFAKEAELAAAGKIPFDQIRGWIKKDATLRPGDWLRLREHGHKLNEKPITPELQEQLGASMAKVYTPNKKFNAAKYQNTRASGGRPELAGFPKESAAWQKEPWKAYQNKKTSESFKQFVSEVCNKAEACIKEQSTSKAGDAGVPNPYEDVDPPCAKETDLKKRAEDGVCVLGPDDDEDKYNGRQTEEEGAGSSEGTGSEGSETETPGSVEEGIGGETAGEKLELARKASDEVFEDLFTSRNMGQKAAALSKDFTQSVKNTRTKALGYKPLTEQSPHFSISKTGLALEGAGLFAWGVGIAAAFTSNTTGWERAAALTALVPILGCGFNTIAESQTKAGIDVIDQMMCITADLLMFTPLAPFAFVIQAFRVIAGLFKTDAVPKPAEAQETRDTAWSKILDDRVYTYYYSDDSLSNNREFRMKLNGTLLQDSMAVLSDAADLIAAANATVQASAKAAAKADKEQINAAVLNATEQIKAEITPKIVSRQRAFLLQLPQRIKQGTDLSVHKMAEQFNKETIEHIQSKETLRHFTPTVFVPPGDRGTDLTEDTRRELNTVAEHLKKTPLPLPKLFDVAYVLGQSKGMLDIDPLTLNPRDFIKSRVPDMREDDVNFYALHHTLQMSMLLRDSITEDKLSKLWPTSDDKIVQELQLLLALKFGRVFDSQKMLKASQLAGQVPTGPEKKFMTHPSIPPLKIAPESMEYIGLILELSADRIKAIPRHNEVVGFKQLGTDEKLIMAMLRKAKKLYVEMQEKFDKIPEEGQAAKAA